MMKRLKAEINVEVTIRIWNAKDCSKTTKWRRTVPECATHWAVSFHQGPKGAPNASESVQNGRYWLLSGCLEAVTLVMKYLLSNGRPGLQCCDRLGSRHTPKCVVR